MPIKADDMLSIAVELSESTNEAKIRASIGRSYYSAYHHGLEYFDITDTKNWVGGRGGVHQKLIDYFADNNHRAASYILTELKTRRHLADYKLADTLSQEDAKYSVNLVRSFLEKIKA